MKNLGAAPIWATRKVLEMKLDKLEKKKLLGSQYIKFIMDLNYTDIWIVAHLHKNGRVPYKLEHIKEAISGLNEMIIEYIMNYKDVTVQVNVWNEQYKLEISHIYQWVSGKETYTNEETCAK